MKVQGYIQNMWKISSFNEETIILILMNRVHFYCANFSVLRVASDIHMKMCCMCSCVPSLPCSVHLLLLLPLLAAYISSTAQHSQFCWWRRAKGIMILLQKTTPATAVHTGSSPSTINLILPSVGLGPAYRPAVGI